jgi:hypothetical protein
MKKYLRIILLLIAIATVFSGLVQVVVPAFVLKIVGAQIDPTTKHFFAIVGMFMFLFGGMMIHALYSERVNNAAILWAGLQKLGAAAAVFIGIAHGLFATIAAAVASFDLVSGILIFIYLRSIKAR